MESRSGTFIFAWLKISISLSMCEFCLLFFILLRNDIIGLCTWLVDLSFSDSSDLEGLRPNEVDACVWLYWIELDGVDTWLSTFFPDLNVWTILHWFNDWSSVKWACWEFLVFVTGWLGKVSFSLSSYRLANWLIWTSSLYTVFMRDSWFSCTFPCFSQNQSFSSHVEDFEKKIEELGWESFVNNLKNGWMIGEIVMVIWKVSLMIGRIIEMLEVAWMVWLWVIIVVLAPWEIWVISPARIVRLCVRIIVRP